MPIRHGGRILVDQLALQGCDTVFCVPGESYLAALDGLAAHPGIRTVVCRQEGGAAMMAEAWGKATGRPGVCFVTRGPGATNAAAGVHVAFQDSTPMVLFVGQVGRGMLDREAFQEVDFRRLFAPLAKWAAQIDETARIPEYVSQAWHRACAGRPGPVVLALPEDMLSASADVPDVPPAVPVRTHPGSAEMARLGELLARAERPLALVGGPGWTEAARAGLTAFAERLSLPVAASFRAQDRFDNAHPCYVGDVGIGLNPELARLVRESDLLLAIGPRLGEQTTGGYTLLEPPVARVPLVHVHPGAEELGRVYRPELAVHADVASFCDALGTLEGLDGTRWAERTRAARASYEAWIEPRETPGEVRLEAVVAHLREVLPPDAVVTNGAGNYTAWVHRYFTYRRLGSQLAPTCGSMGYGLPAAIAAKLAWPARDVVCVAGDGCLMMTVQELATAVQHELPIVVLVANNGMYGTIRMHQERLYPGRTCATALRNPDFAALARSHGAHGTVVERDADFPGALAEARAAGGPALVELRLDPEALTPRATLSEIRRQGETRAAAAPA